MATGGLYPLHVKPASPVDLVQILLYRTKLDSKPSLEVNSFGPVVYNLCDSVLGRALRSENNTILVPCLHHGIHRQPVTVASNGTTFGRGGQQMKYSEEGKDRLFLFFNLLLSVRGRADPHTARPAPVVARAALQRRRCLPPIPSVSFCANLPRRPLPMHTRVRCHCHRCRRPCCRDWSPRRQQLIASPVPRDAPRGIGVSPDSSCFLEYRPTGALTPRHCFEKGPRGGV